MSRIRTVKPELPADEKLAGCSRDARLLFVYLFTQSDCWGNQRANTKLLRGALFPYDDITIDDVDGWLGELERHGLVGLYEHSGQHYLHLFGFTKNQRITRPSRLVPWSPWDTPNDDGPVGTALHADDVARNVLSTDALGTTNDAPTVPYRKGSVPRRDNVGVNIEGSGFVPLVEADGPQTHDPETVDRGLTNIAGARASLRALPEPQEASCAPGRSRSPPRPHAAPQFVAVTP
mgnify:CR=1 FL=1